MRMRWLTVFLLAATAAEGRSPIPLMPPREPTVALTEQELREVSPPPRRFAFLESRQATRPQRTRSPSYSKVTAEADSSSHSAGALLGIELGTLGRQNSAGSDALGLKLLVGGRFFMILPLASRIYLKPSLGFFYRGDSVAKVGLSENVVEGGLTAQYAFSQSGSVNWLVGVVNRLDVAFSRASVDTLAASDAPVTAAGTSAPGFRYRLGPSLGFTYKVTPTVGLLLDAEATFSFSNPIKAFGGLVGGLIFRL